MLNVLRVIARVAHALQKLTNSASMHIGADCMMQAKLAQRILQEEGINTRVVVGEAAWRVGPGDGDVITHSPRIGGFAPQGVKAVAFHAWLEMGSTIVDFTTHSLKSKAAGLDELDGKTTSVLWCPEYLVMPTEDALQLQEVTQAPKEGVACYQEIPELLEYLIFKGLQSNVDEEDAILLRMIYEAPDMFVIGPNDLVSAGSGFPMEECASL